jgi:hypothetical protein
MLSNVLPLAVNFLLVDVWPKYTALCRATSSSYISYSPSPGWLTPPDPLSL